MSYTTRDTPKSVILTVRCGTCRVPTELIVAEHDLLAWQGGKLAQDAFPYLSPEERELLISQTCGGCWDMLFGGLDDEGYEGVA